MRMEIDNNIKSTLPRIENQNAKDFLKLVEEKFRSTDKALARTLMAELTTMKLDGLKSMQHHVLDMTNTAARLKTLGKMDISKKIVLSVRLGSKRKDTLRIILALVAQMDVKTAFLDENIEEEVYMEQPKGFFIDGLGVVDTVSKLLKICCDNAAIIFFSKNDKYSKGTKHMDIKFFIMKEEIQKQIMYLEHISTDLMIVDPLTKGLPPKEFMQYVPRLGLGRIDN
nr:hypothetical protein [Tanacetum cinerariifolium]